MKGIETLKTFIRRNNLIIAFIFFTIIFTVNYLPFFIYIPVPAIGWDTYGYFWFAEKIINCELPVTNAPIDMPVGFPLFLALCKMFSMNIIHIVLMQTILLYLACIYLIYQISDLFKSASIIAAFSLVLYVLQPFVLRNTITLYPDSLYCSSLIFLTGSIYKYSFRKDTFSFIMILMGLLLSILIRSNGIFLYFIPLIIIGWALIKRKNIKKYILSFVIMIILLSLINLFTKGYFFPGEKDRISNVSRNVMFNLFGVKLKNKDAVITKSKKNIQITHISADGTTTLFTTDTTDTGRIINQIRYTQTKRVMYKEYLKLFSKTKPSFYYSLMPTIYKGTILKDLPQADSVIFNGSYFIDEFAPTLLKFIYDKYNNIDFINKKYTDAINYYNPYKNKLMLISHYSYQIIDKLKLNLLIHILFFIVIVFSIYQCFFKKSCNKIYCCLLFVSLVYLIHYLLLPIVHGRVQERYLFVTEFIIYLNAISGLYLILMNLRKDA